MVSMIEKQRFSRKTLTRFFIKNEQNFFLTFFQWGDLFFRWEKGEEGGRNEERGGRKKKTTPYPPPLNMASFVIAF
jgi:hypothetical protein